MSRTLRVLVADDELMARKRLARLLSAVADVELAGEARDGEEVLAKVKEGAIDVVLLDINMPGLTGVDAMQLMPEDGPFIVFCTAHAEHAITAFEGGAVDYLLKPVEASRLQKALDRARSRLALKDFEAGNAAGDEPARGEAALDRLAIPTRQGVVLVDPREITHAALEGELVTVFTTGGDYLTDFTLQDLELRLPNLERVHRRALLNLAHVVRLEPCETGGFLARTARGQSVLVSRQAARELRRRLGLRRDAGEDEEG